MYLLDKLQLQRGGLVLENGDVARAYREDMQRGVSVETTPDNHVRWSSPDSPVRWSQDTTLSRTPETGI